MKIEVVKVRENEDGSADAEVFLDEEAKEMLIRKAIVDSLKEYVDTALKENTPKEEEE